jgi:glycosyltransferase involved in cell wall biosynthesis
LIASRLLHIPCIVSLGGDYRLAQELERRYYILNSRFLSFKIEEIVLRGANTVFCPNHFTCQYVIHLGVDPSRVKKIPIRLSNDLFDFSVSNQNILEKAGVNITRPIVLFVGRFEKDKQVEVLIEAIPLIVKESGDVQFVFIGDGSLKPLLRERTTELQIDQWVWFLGFQNTDVIKYCLKVSSVVWIPMSGFVIFEAAAAGKPIIAFDVEWHSEFVKDGVTGILIKNRDVESMAKGVLNLLEDKNRREALGKRGREELEREYHPKRLIEMEIEEYRNLLRGKSVLKM